MNDSGDDMPKRKEPELDPAERLRRFKEAAKAVEADESGAEFEKAFKAAMPPRKKPKK
ncbi:hypothetical protein [Hyphomicrobium sp. 2TAF46]|uniref:hypothetical protein n=1 Tax=Hyphomicrobium sp. 2TAF46 TaxID=3233019 RepID=UPI003F8EC176